jgi:diguanylate cyclase (GGDEF)-like protein
VNPVRALSLALLASLPAAAAEPVVDTAQKIRDLQTLVLMMGAGIVALLLYITLRIRGDTKRLHDLAETDALTRLPNRRHLLTEAEALLDLSFAAQTPLSVIAFDLDDFKQINDAHGHATGDQVLRKVAHTCRLALRPNDRIGRVGSGEFIVVLPNTAESGALSVAIRLRVAVEMLTFEGAASALKATISLGLAQRRDTDTLAHLIARADARLAKAKDGGRNRVEPATA